MRLFRERKNRENVWGRKNVCSKQRIKKEKSLIRTGILGLTAVALVGAIKK